MRRAPGLALLRTKPPRSAAVADGNTAMRALPAMKRLFLMPSLWRGEAGIVSTAIAIRLLFGSLRPRPRLSCQKQGRHAPLVLPYQPCRREPFAQRRTGAVKHRSGGHRMLPPAAGAFEDPRSSRQLIS